MVIKKSPRLMVLLIALSVVAAACGGGTGTAASGGGDGASNGDTGSADRPFEGRTLRVALWGGSWTEGVRDSVGVRFEEETGATVEYIQGAHRSMRHSCSRRSVRPCRTT